MAAEDLYYASIHCEETRQDFRISAPPKMLRNPTLTVSCNRGYQVELKLIAGKKYRSECKHCGHKDVADFGAQSQKDTNTQDSRTEDDPGMLCLQAEEFFDPSSLECPFSGTRVDKSSNFRGNHTTYHCSDCGQTKQS